MPSKSVAVELGATSLNNLAEVYRSQGRYGNADPLYKGALAIYQKVLGPRHPNVASSFKQSRPVTPTPSAFKNRALAIRKKVLGSDHPDVALSLGHLAGLYDDHGRYAEAEPLYKRALAIREKTLGPDHPDVARSLNDLALNCLERGQLEEALNASRRAIKIHASRIERGANDRLNSSASEQKSGRESFLTLLLILAAWQSGPSAEIVEEAFRAAQ